MATGRNRERSNKLTKWKTPTASESPIIRATVDIGHVAGRLFICIGVCIGQWFIGIRRMP